MSELAVSASPQSVVEDYLGTNSRDRAAEKGIVVAAGFGVKLYVERGHLVLNDGIGRQRRVRRYSRATAKLRRVLVLGHSGFVTLEALRWLTDVGAAFPHTVTLHTSCHSLRSLHIGDQPERLLAAVQGLQLVTLPRRDECCGFGGTFSVKNAGVSTAMAADKVACVLGTGAEVCTAGDNSCLMQIGGALRRGNAAVRCLHLAEILASAAPGELPP